MDTNRPLWIFKSLDTFKAFIFSVVIILVAFFIEALPNILTAIIVACFTFIVSRMFLFIRSSVRAYSMRRPPITFDSGLAKLRGKKL